MRVYIYVQVPVILLKLYFFAKTYIHTYLCLFSKKTDILLYPQ
jgi:hypothetical protein